MSIPYNNIIPISYSNDLEYRNCMRNLFSMNHAEEIIDDIDDISKDENDYDTDASTKALDFIYLQTCFIPCFQSLYDVAASKMLSMDREIGLAVLFSYDYMSLFHKCVCCFLENPQDFNEMTEDYIRLYEKIK